MLARSSIQRRPTRASQQITAWIHNPQSASLYTEWYKPTTKPSSSATNETKPGAHQPTGRRPIVFLHGLLGNARNVKTMAKKLCDQTGAPGLLMDLTGHGRSSIHSTVGSVTFERVCNDIQRTLKEKLPQQENITFVGHSLGGRLALQYASDERLPAPHAVWMLDTVPGQPDESVLGVLHAAELVSQRHSWRSRSEITIALTEVHELPPAIAEWLAAQYDVKDQRFAFDIRAAESLADDFGSQDFWQQIDGRLDQKLNIHLVQGGKNKAWDKATAAIDERKAKYKTFETHILPNAGHWVHVDDLPGLLSAFKSEHNW